MARPGRVRIVIRQPLVPQHIAVIIDPRPHGACADFDVVHGLKAGDEACDEGFSRLVPDFAAVNRRAPTRMGGLLQQQHFCAGFPGTQGRLQSGNTAADHKHIAKGVEVFVSVHIAVFGGRTKACGLADKRLVDVFPQRSGMDEHFVIETRRHEPAEFGVHRADVEFQAGPVVLAFGFQPVKQFRCRHPLIGFKLAAFTEIDQTVGFLRARSDNATRAVIFERPAHQHLIIGQQCGRQRIPFKSAQRAPVESEGHGAVFVQQAAACGKTSAHVIGPLWMVRR